MMVLVKFSQHFQGSQNFVKRTEEKYFCANYWLYVHISDQQFANFASYLANT